MNERDFDQIFSEGLNENPPSDYNPQVWANIAGRLAQDKRRKKRLLLLPFFLPFALLLGNVWTWKELKNTQQELASLQKKELSRDTIIQYQKEVLNHYDTIYRTIYIHDKKSTNQTELEHYLNQWLVVNKDKIIQENNNLIKGKNSEVVDLHNIIKENNKSNSTVVPIKYFSVTELLPYLDLKELEIKKRFVWMERVEKEADKPKKENKIAIATKEFTPNGREASFGIGVPKTVEKLNPNSSINIQINHDWNVGKHFSIGTGLAYQKMHVKTLTYIPEWEIPVPILPTNDYFLKYIEGDYKNLQPTLRLKYAFSPKNNFTPFIGIGYGVQKRLKSIFEYEFKNSFDVEQAQQKEIIFNNLVWNIAQFNTGIEYHFSDLWSGKLDLTYQTQLGNKNQIFSTLNTAFALKRNLSKKKKN